MERDELSRLREEFEQLYQQPDSSYSRNIYLKNTAQNSKSDRPGGLWRTLQNLWQRASALLTEDDNAEDFGQSNLTWWRIHHLRMGGYNPGFLEQDASYTKVWLERLYRN